MASSIAPKTQEEKKRLGAFYTPQELSDILASWAIISKSGKILEPSFGGCGFLKSSADRLKELGASSRKLELYGCDIDPKAFNHLSNTVGNLVDTSRFALGDFLALEKPQSWPNKFDVILGNPPYIPYQDIPLESRNAAIKKMNSIGFDIDLRSSLWAYFVMLSLYYISEGGNIAWVLPGSFLQANYSKSVRLHLNSKFEKLVAFQIRERLFLYEGTDETTVVLLGKSYDEKRPFKTTDVDLVYCKSYTNLPNEINKWETNLSQLSSCASPVLGVIDSKARVSYSELLLRKECKSIGDFSSVKIGLVTGANKFFVINKKTASENNLQPSRLIPILGKYSFVQGLSYSIHDHLSHLKGEERCLLVSYNREKIGNKPIANYLKKFPKEERLNNSTFKKKKIWHAIQDKKIPDAFFPVMHHTSPVIALNDAQINCTNSIHRVFFKKNVSVIQRKLIAISMLTNFSQLSAEIEGRKYGSGVLKHEPREAEKIKVLIPENVSKEDVQSTYNKINNLLILGDHAKASDEADRFIFKNLKLSNILALQEHFKLGVYQARKQRYANRKKKTK